jgi:hypothetical protein
MRCKRNAPRCELTSWHVLRSIVCATPLLISLYPTCGRSQSPGESQLSSPGSITISELSKQARLRTYYGGTIPKDGYVIVPVKPDIRNFLECDLTSIAVDESTLKISDNHDCNMGKNDPGLIKGYIKALEANGDVKIETKFGSETIAKNKWEKLVSSVAPLSGTEGKSSVFNVGDFAAFQQNEKGSFATIFKLAPNETGGGHQM